MILRYSPKFRILNHYAIIDESGFPFTNPCSSHILQKVSSTRNWCFALPRIPFWWTFILLIREMVVSLVLESPAHSPCRGSKISSAIRSGGTSDEVVPPVAVHPAPPRLHSEQRPGVLPFSHGAALATALYATWLQRHSFGTRAISDTGMAPSNCCLFPFFESSFFFNGIFLSSCSRCFFLCF